MNCREEFRALTSGWTLVMSDIDDRLEELAKWCETHQPLTDYEEKTIL